MATPIYKGRGQPNPGGSGWLGSLFGGPPTYGGAGQPVQKSSPILGGSQPAYKPATTVETSDATGMDANACGPIAIVIPRQVIEQQ